MPTTSHSLTPHPPTRPQVRKNLHVVLCFSPVGDGFRKRARAFPALVNCTAIDWFHPWPRGALISGERGGAEGGGQGLWGAGIAAWELAGRSGL